MDGASDEVLIFRVTGPQSIERLEPLVSKTFPRSRSLCSGPGSRAFADAATGAKSGAQAPPTSVTEAPHFVWETTCEQTWREWHSKALVLNKLHNSTVLEDKSNLAFLQLRIREHYEHVLPTFVASGTSEALRWAEERWGSGAATAVPAAATPAPGASSDADWWVLKASGGNGGKDVWVISRENYRDVLTSKMPYRYVLCAVFYVLCAVCCMSHREGRTGALAGMRTDPSPPTHPPHTPAAPRPPHRKSW